MIFVELAFHVIGHVGRENRRHECQFLLGRERFRRYFELLGGQLLDDLHVDPALVRIIAEQVALDPAARTDIGVAADEPRLGVSRLDRPVEERAADIVRIVTIIGPAHAIKHARLAIDIGRDSISLGDPQRDLARRQRREDHRRQFGKPYPLLNEAGRHAEAFRHILGARAPIEEVLEGRAFIRRVHRDPVEILGKAGFRRSGIIFEHQHLNLMVPGKPSGLDQPLKRPQAPPAGLHGIVSRLLQRRDHEILQQALRGDIVGQAVEVGIAIGLADIVLGQREVLDLHGLDHRSSPSRVAPTPSAGLSHSGPPRRRPPPLSSIA